MERIETKPSAGFASAISEEGRVTEDTTGTDYRVPVKGLRTFAMSFNTRVDDDLYRPNYAFMASGRRYISTLPRDRTTLREVKGFWFRRT